MCLAAGNGKLSACRTDVYVVDLGSHIYLRHPFEIREVAKRPSHLNIALSREKSRARTLNRYKKRKINAHKETFPVSADFVYCTFFRFFERASGAKTLPTNDFSDCLEFSEDLLRFEIDQE